MAGTVVADTLQAASTSTLVLKNGVANTPPTIQDSAGTQIGTFCRAWANWNGTGVVAIRAAFNVSSITDNGTGDYTVNLATAMPDANYSVISSSEGGGSVGNPPYQRGNYPITSASNIRLTFFNQSASVFVDPAYCCAAVFR